MHKNVLQGFVLIAILVMLVSCANRGTPSGGPKDEEAPKIIKASPENFTTNFNGKEIRISFDEYVKIKNLQKQLIISPPMDPEPTVTPLGTASKYIKIIINDTLEANTTYAFNFGQSIVDNNEENPYDYYRYVFSTGDVIDSLSVKGQVMDAQNRETDAFISVMLYEIDSTYTDSTVFKQRPKYITNTLDSLTTFSIDNIKPGTYKLVALKDENGNFTFQQGSDKIGFYEGYITAPTDSLYTIKLFNETLNFDVKRPRQVAGQKIAFGYQGDYKDMEIELLGNRPDGFKTRITKDEKADTLYYWYKPNIEADSAKFVVRNKSFVDTLNHRFRVIDRDSLVIKSTVSGTINFNNQFGVSANIPLENINTQHITILDKDSLNVPFETSYSKLENTYRFQFEKEELQTYKIQMLPGAFEDFFGNVNDTLNYNLKTKQYSDYTNIRVRLENAVYPVIVQLTNEKGEMKYQQFATEERLFDFRNLTPAKYYIKVIYDTNGNQQWDSGNYLLQRQAERVSFAKGFIDGRAGWDYPEEVFILD
ncbi:Ig-like domain-containing protein [Psychroserpens sp. SPM9]|uniref:Ig-like domain-containing protein n=1 Tax=Psychroserpens sp. SPM9 TaxID=2975598 RepID=UPI0021A95008|nr:Ig-like domain-containing protein [Psychroserpens sp. SPM9]MDG5490431.1 Ig-like domain-containing protein [Psychroserpens sp. SPM9]